MNKSDNLQELEKYEKELKQIITKEINEEGKLSKYGTMLITFISLTLTITIFKTIVTRKE